MVDSNLKKIGDMIRETRKNKGISQEGLAAISKLGRTYTGRVERGEQNISIHNLLKIAFALDVNVGELIPPIAELERPTFKRP